MQQFRESDTKRFLGLHYPNHHLNLNSLVIQGNLPVLSAGHLCGLKWTSVYKDHYCLLILLLTNSWVDEDGHYGFFLGGGWRVDNNRRRGRKDGNEEGDRQRGVLLIGVFVLS